MTDDPRIDPADLRNVRFPGSSRRYDARAVEQFLESVATRIEATNTLVDELRRELFEVRQETPAAPAPDPTELSTLDDDDLVRLVGEETATVLSTARRAAEGIRSKAEESAARVIREATAEADRVTEEAKARAVELTAGAEEAMEQATAAAEAEAARIREEAEQAAEALTAETREKVEVELAELEARRTEAESEVEQILEAAREEGRGMVAEAKEVRHRILEALQRRRDMAREQIERLLAGRERLLDAYELVRENLDDITGQLADSLPDPRDVPVPDLPDGFVGIVGADTDEGDDGVDDVPGVEVADDEPGAVVVDDTVAPEADDTRAPEPAVDGEESAVPEAEAEAGEAPGADESTPETGDGDVDGAGEPEDGAGEGDVDALFARLRAEREQSVAQAQQVLEGDRPVEAEAEAEAEADASAEVEPEPGTEVEPETETETETETEVEGARGDVDLVPAEFLADPEALEQRAEALKPLTSSLNRALKRKLADEQNQLLDLLRRSGSTVADDLLPAADDQVGTYAGVAEKHLAAAAAAGASAAGAEGAPVDVSELALGLGATLVEPFRRRVERSASEVDGDADELDERLRALYREWKVQHIGPATDDALLSAYALGTLRAVEPGGRVRWRIDPEQGPCPDAQDNALAGAVDAGEAFPTGDACPQAHPGCRCLLVVE